MGPRELTGISTQGDTKSNLWVTAFNVQYSQDGHQWNTILEANQNEKVQFDGIVFKIKRF